MFRKPQPHSPPSHQVSVKLAPGLEITANGWGLVVAPLLMAMVLVALIVMTFGAGRVTTSVMNHFAAQEAPATLERPPT